MAVIIAFEFANFLGEGYDVDNRRVADEWNPLYRAATFRLCGQSSAIQIDNGDGKSSLTEACLYVLSRNSELKKRITSKFAPSDCGWTHVRIEFGIKDEDIRQPSLITADPAEFPGTTYVVGLCGNRDDQDWNFYLYQGTLDDTKTHIKNEKGLKLVDNESFRKSVTTLHGAKWNKWSRVRDWLDEIKEFTSIEVVKQNVEFQLKGAGDASAMLHNIKPQGNEDYDAAFFQQLIAPELVSNAMEFANRLEGRDSDKEERNLEDTLLRSLQSASNATIAISDQEEKLRQAQIALDKFKPVLDKAHEVIGASSRYEELLDEVAQSASLIYELAEKNPFPGLPRNPERRNYDKRIMSIFSFMVIDRKGGVLILDEGLNVLTGVETKKINEKAQDLGLHLFLVDTQPIDFKGDLVNIRSGNKGGGYNRKGYPLYSAINLISKLEYYNAFNADADLTEVLKQSFEIAINELDTNVYRRETYQSLKILELETVRVQHQNSVKKAAEKEIEDLQASEREVGENQIAFETFKTQAESFPLNLRDTPLDAETWLNQEHRSVLGLKSEHDKKVGNLEAPYKNWEILTDKHGLVSLSEVRDQLDIQKQGVESNVSNAKTAHQKIQCRIKEDLSSKLKIATERFDHAQKILQQFEVLQPHVEDFGRIFGDVDPELLDPLQEKDAAIKSKGELDQEIQNLRNQLIRFQQMSSSVTLFKKVFGNVDPLYLDPFSDLQRLQEQIRGEQEIVNHHRPLVDALNDFGKRFPDASPDAWLETIEKERIALLTEQKDNDDKIIEHERELADLEKHAVADTRIYSDALQELDKSSIPFKRLHVFLSERATDSIREAHLLTLFASALSAPVFDNIEEADTATRLLEEHKLTIPVFLAGPLTEFIVEGKIDITAGLAHTFLAGRRTRQVEILLNPDLIKDERKRIEGRTALLQKRNTGIKARLTEIHSDCPVVQLALDAKKALLCDSVQCLSTGQKNLLELQQRLPDIENKASRECIDSIAGMRDFLALGGELKLREIENDALPVATEQMTEILSRIAKLEPKTTTEALTALNSAITYKRAGGNAVYQNSKEGAAVASIQVEEFTKQLRAAEAEEQNLSSALETAREALFCLMNTYPADIMKLDEAIMFETDGSLHFMRKADEITQSLEQQLETLQQLLKTDFKRAQKFKDWSTKGQKDFAKLIADAKARKGKADNEILAANNRIQELSEQISTLKEYSITLHDLAVTVRRQYSQIYGLPDDIFERIKSGKMMNKGELFDQFQEARVAFLGELPNLTLEFSGLLNNLNQQISAIHLDTPGIRHCERERDSAQADFVSRRNDFCAKARSGEINGLHTLEIEHIEKAVTLEELKAVEGLENKIKQRIEDDLKELTGTREAMQTAKEASIDNMVKFSLLADLNLRTMNEVMEKTPKARFIIETQVASEERIRQVVEWLIGQIEDRERSHHQRMQGISLNADIANKNRDYSVMIRDTLYRHLFIDPHVYFTHAGIWEGKKSPIINDKLSMGQKTALHIMWMIKQAEYSLARAVRDYGTRKERKAAAQKAQRILFFDGLFSNLSNENIIDDAFEGLKYVGDNFQLIGLLHHPRYVNNPEIFKSHLVGQRFRRIGEKRSRGFVAVEPWQEGGNMAIFSSYYKRKPVNGETHAGT
jgi:hypothetical protein